MYLFSIELLFGLASAVGGLVTALVLRKEVAQIGAGGIAILALGWGVASAAAILSNILLWDAPFWLDSTVFGAVFGLVGGGVTLWQARRGRVAADATQ